MSALLPACAVRTPRSPAVAPPPCRSVEGASAVIAPRSVALFGEFHGTNESPAAFGDVICMAASQGPVVVGVEFPHASTPSLQAYVHSNGDSVARMVLLADPFWSTEPRDGRASDAMLSLFERVRQLSASSATISIFGFSEEGLASGQVRDSLMALHIADEIRGHSDATVVVLTGNIHSRLRIGTSFDRQYRPMGYLLRQLVPRIPLWGLDVRFSSGSAWICPGTEGSTCGPHPLPSRFTQAPWSVITATPSDTNAYNAWYGVGPVTASPPAVRRDNP